MKLIYKLPKYTHYNNKRAISQNKRRLKHNDKIKHKNYYFHSLPKPQTDRRIQKDIERTAWNYVTAPKDFSFRNNTEQCLLFLDEIDKLYELRKPIWVILKQVERADHDSIVLLLSSMIYFRESGIAYNGDFPKNLEIKAKLQESGFLDVLYKKYTYNKAKSSLKGENNLIITNWSTKVNASLSSHIIHDATKFIWGNEKRNPGIQRNLIELMLNTHNHADLDEQNVEHWYLSIEKDKLKNRVCFSFIDYGVGVFTSLTNKKPGNKFFGILEKLKIKHKVVETDEDLTEEILLKQILIGELHKTATGKYYRGKGLPGLKDMLDRKWFSNLYIITNKAYSNVTDGEYRLLNNSFKGTFIYWELTKENKYCDR